MNTCTLCHGVGWVLETHPNRLPLTVELIPCLIPDCPFTGQHIELISVNDLQFTNVTTHPKSHIVMSLGRNKDESQSK